MKITYVSTADQSDPDSFSGTCFWISKSLKNQMDLQDLYINDPQRVLPFLDEFIFRCRSLWYHFYKRMLLDPQWQRRRAEQIATVVKEYLNHIKTDAILTALSPISGAYLEINKPIIYWSDYVFGSLIPFYPFYPQYHPETAFDAHFVTSACLMNAKLLIFSSEWAARSAIEFYGISKEKVKVVPFGANIEITHTYDDVKNFIQARSRKCIKLLHVGKQWYRKGGDVVLKIAKHLHDSGHPVEVTIVGCTPPDKNLPTYVKCEEMLSKKKPENIEKLKSLYREAHFLFVPSRAEAFGIVFCEANAFAVPCISTHVGGISEIIKDGINGITFSFETTVQEYCDYIVNTWSNYPGYEALALSSFNEYTTRLNWQVAASKVKSLIAEVI